MRRGEDRLELRKRAHAYGNGLLAIVAQPWASEADGLWCWGCGIHEQHPLDSHPPDCLWLIAARALGIA